MKVILFGYGKMGRLLAETLREKGHEVLGAIDPYYSGGAPGLPLYKSKDDFFKGPGYKGADMALEFTRPAEAVGNLKYLAKEKVPVVVGTTGWYESLPEISETVAANGSSLLWASNFSLGVNLFYRIAEHTAKLIDPFAEYDAAGLETHHNRKLDSPSGTAQIIAERVLAQMTRKKRAVYDKLDRAPEADELHFASVRVGYIFGAHILLFDSPADTIEITHNAKNRDGLVSGAVFAAEWLHAKKRTGVFTIDDALADILPS